LWFYYRRFNTLGGIIYPPKKKHGLNATTATL
jgi:hypothetical protein